MIIDNFYLSKKKFKKIFVYEQIIFPEIMYGAIKDEIQIKKMIKENVQLNSRQFFRNSKEWS